MAPNSSCTRRALVLRKQSTPWPGCLPVARKLPWIANIETVFRASSTCGERGLIHWSSLTVIAAVISAVVLEWYPTSAQELLEGVVDGRVVQAAGTLVQEQRGVRRAGTDPVSCLQVLLQGVAGGAAQGYPAGFAELSLGKVEALLVAVEGP
jgi:hypothetical protein